MSLEDIRHQSTPPWDVRKLMPCGEKQRKRKANIPLLHYAIIYIYRLIGRSILKKRYKSTQHSLLSASQVSIELGGRNVQEKGKLEAEVAKLQAQIATRQAEVEAGAGYILLKADSMTSMDVSGKNPLDRMSKLQKKRSKLSCWEWGSMVRN